MVIHTSLAFTLNSFQAVYGYPPPTLCTHVTKPPNDWVRERSKVLAALKDNLIDQNETLYMQTMEKMSERGLQVE